MQRCLAFFISRVCSKLSALDQLNQLVFILILLDLLIQIENSLLVSIQCTDVFTVVGFLRDRNWWLEPRARHDLCWSHLNLSIFSLVYKFVECLVDTCSQQDVLKLAVAVGFATLLEPHCVLVLSCNFFVFFKLVSIPFLDLFVKRVRRACLLLCRFIAPEVPVEYFTRLLEHAVNKVISARFQRCRINP